MALASLADRPPTTPAEAAQGRSAPGKVTGRLKLAIEAMVWKGLKRSEAAADAKLSEHSLYVALRRPHVKAFYLAELEVLRTSERARNIKRLTEIRDAKDNMPAVQAIAMLERMSDESPTRSAGSVGAPGMTIQIVQIVQPGPSPMVTDTRLTQKRELLNDINE